MGHPAGASVEREGWREGGREDEVEGVGSVSELGGEGGGGRWMNPRREGLERKR